MKIHWWEVYGKWTCHRNVPGLTYVESFVGEVYDDGYGWYYRVSGSEICEERYSDSDRAKKALLKVLGAEPVNTWD